jgi:hypothetical protein
MYVKQHCVSRIILAGCTCLLVHSSVDAAEYGFSTYGLGSSAFSAGVTPPPGTYVTEAVYL